jgi:hypothetical protein
MYNVLICTPTLGSVKSRYFTSILNTIVKVNDFGIDVDVMTIDNQLTQRARNILTQYFVKHDKYTHLFFIDSDIGFSPNDFIKLVRSGQRVICGLYPNKVYLWDTDRCIKGRDFLVDFSSRIGDEQLRTFDKKTQLCEIDKAATGFMCIERSVFEELKPAFDKYRYNGEDVTDFWNCKVIDNEWMTEDYVFSHVLHQHDIKIMCDMTIQLTHVGENPYTCNPINRYGLEL